MQRVTNLQTRLAKLEQIAIDRSTSDEPISIDLVAVGSDRRPIAITRHTYRDGDVTVTFYDAQGDQIEEAQWQALHSGNGDYRYPHGGG